jgi:putative spermidine/putrescine transport system permease protein
MARGGRRIGASLGLVPFLLYTGIFLLIPTIVVFVKAFQVNPDSGGTGFTMSAIDQLKSDAIIKITKDTLVLSLTTALVGAVVGAVVAYVVSTAQQDGVLRRFVSSFCGVLAQFGGVALAFAFIATLGNTGVVTGWLNLDDVRWLFTLKGLTLVYLYFQIPLMVIVFLPALDGIRPQWREAADNLGASTWQYWRHIGIPLLLPAFLGSALLLFANAFATYATARALVNQGSPLLSLKIGGSLGNELGLQEGNLAAALALEMVVIVAVVMTGYALLQRRASRWLR